MYTVKTLQRPSDQDLATYLNVAKNNGWKLFKIALAPEGYTAERVILVFERDCESVRATL
jgi:hypothetical protein